MKNDISQLKGIIYESLLGTIRRESTRKDDKVLTIHASAVGKMCPRMIYYARKNKKKVLNEKVKSYLDIGTAVTFSIGMAVEDFVVKSLGNILSNKIWVRYSCPKCGYSDIMLYKKSGYKCPQCNNGMAERQISIEHQITDDVVITGNMDLILYNKNLGDKFNVIELKTMKEEDFDVLKQPLVNHELQIQTYLWLIKNLPLGDKKKYSLNSKYGYIVYICKKHKKDPIKIFKVNLRKDFVNQLESDIEAIKSGELPDRVCLNENSLIARDCPFRDICFRR